MNQSISFGSSPSGERALVLRRQLCGIASGRRVEGIEDLLPDPGLAPALIASVDGFPGAELLGEIPTGRSVILSASFEKQGEEPRGVAQRTLSLYFGERKVGETQIQTQPGFFALTGDGLCVGRDSGAPVTHDYLGEMPWRFTGGTIKRVAVDVSGEHYVDLEREAVAMMARE
jgi:hypothetical protein